MSADEGAGETTICAGCGLCCDGSLFSHVIVRDEDRETVATAKLPVNELEDTPIFTLPCAMLMNGLCSVYAVRPSTCERYRCKLRISVDSDELSEAEARDKISTAKVMGRRLREATQGVRTLGDRKALTARLREGFDNCDEEERSERSRLLLQLAAFEYYMERWFREER